MDFLQIVLESKHYAKPYLQVISKQALAYHWLSVNLLKSQAPGKTELPVNKLNF